MKRLIRALRKRHFAYETLVEVRISRADLLHNLAVLGSIKPGVSVAPVLKSNAYGHGLIEVGKIFDGQSVPFLCVDSYFEAMILRNEGVRVPLLVIGYTPPKNMHTGLHDVAFGVFSLPELRRLVKHATSRTAIHLEIDTGMRRHGIMPDELAEAMDVIESNPRIHLEGMFTHFADADTPGSEHARSQVRVWNSVVPQVRELFPGVKHYHCGGTAAASYMDELDMTTLRSGIGLYGFNTSTLALDIRPALELSSRITALRTLKAGESIGYNVTFTATHDMRIATVAVGYYEGVERALSNKGVFIVRDVPCPIVGKVSMNMTMIDVSSVPDVAIDESVTVISKDPAAPNSLNAIAELTGVLPYELRVHIPPHLRRTIV